MQSMNYYHSPIGEITLTADETGLTGLWFDGEKYETRRLGAEHKEQHLPVFDQAKQWLEIYFSGKEPAFCPPLHLAGTPFQLSVWKLLREIPYGKTTTYGALAKEIAQQKGIARMSAQAVGGAVGRNPISIIIPCHRVIGANGDLTGYAGGIDKKEKLLAIENIAVIK